MQVRLPGVEGDAHGDVFFSWPYSIIMHWQFRFARLACAAAQSLQSALAAAGITLKFQLQFTLQAAGERRAREDVICVRRLSEEDIHERGIEVDCT